MAKHRQVTGDVKWARFTTEPSFARRQRRRHGARARGKQYETRALAALADMYSERVLNSPWIEYLDEAGHHWCQPDSLLFNVEKGIITIIEVKYQHTADAWLQLRRLYQPILEFLFSTHDALWTINVVEMVRWYEPHTSFPESDRMCPIIHQAHLSMFNVHIWNP